MLKSQRIDRREAVVLAGPGAAAPARAKEEGNEPKVHVRRDPDGAAALEIHCPCGRHLVLDCLYDPAADDVSPA